MPVQPSSAYYLGLLTSQYQNATSLKGFLAALIQPFLDAAACADSISAAFDINAATGVQLDALGVLVGASRTLPFQPSAINATTTTAVTSTGVGNVGVNNTLYMRGGSNVVITGSDGHTETVAIIAAIHNISMRANFTQTHVIGSTITSALPFNPLLSDDDYRVLLRAKIARNQWDGQVSSMWALWQQLFPGGRIYITDNQDMTATVLVTGAFTPVQEQMITLGLIVPRPEAVQYTYALGTPPFFGFDGLDPVLIAGFETGFWS